MNVLRRNMWFYCVAFFFVGDLVTTFFGMSNSMVGEANPLMAEYYYRDRFDLLLMFKGIITFFAYLVDDVVVHHYPNWAFPFIPLALGSLGLWVTVQNLLVLQYAGENAVIVVFITALLGYVTYDVMKNRA